MLGYCLHGQHVAYQHFGSAHVKSARSCVSLLCKHARAKSSAFAAFLSYPGPILST